VAISHNQCAIQCGIARRKKGGFIKNEMVFFINVESCLPTFARTGGELFRGFNIHPCSTFVRTGGELFQAFNIHPCPTFARTGGELFQAFNIGVS
jgi:hypothetical protein